MSPRRQRTVSRSAPSPAAARMRRFRARNRAAGLSERRRWMAAEPSWSDHRLHEVRSLALHALIARKLARDPGLLVIPRRNLERWARGGVEGRTYLREWGEILSRPLPEILAFITSGDERATRLRQSSPFAGVLGADERRRVFEAFRA